MSTNPFLQLNLPKIDKLLFELEGQRLTNQYNDIDIIFISKLMIAMVSEIKKLTIENSQLKEQN
jgi:hypothetical protein